MQERKRRKIEREFGVPIAGEILEPEFWTQTALKKLPNQGTLDLNELFGRTAPLIVDVGCGNGRFILGSSVWRESHDHLGADILPVVIRYATRRGNQRGLKNLRFLVTDGLNFVEKLLPTGSVTELHCYHPQPYHDPEKSLERLLTPRFLAAVHRVLVHDGQIFLQTDSKAYWDYIKSIVSNFFSFNERIGCWPDAPRGRTRREILSLKRGMNIYRGHGTRLNNLTENELQKLESDLPMPLFTTESYLQKLDYEESQSNEKE